MHVFKCIQYIVADSCWCTGDHTTLQINYKTNIATSDKCAQYTIHKHVSICPRILQEQDEGSIY